VGLGTYDCLTAVAPFGPVAAVILAWVTGENGGREEEEEGEGELHGGR
jgi:hypothetical protein